MNNGDPPATPPANVPQHGIAVVEQRTGVSQHTLRAWERRYGVVSPVRSEAGQRLYSDDDIERIRLVRTVSASGRRVSQVASLSRDQLQALAQRDATEAVPLERVSRNSVRNSVRTSGTAPSDGDEHLRACRDAVARMDGDAVYTLLMRAAISLEPAGFIDAVALPLLRQAGDDWESGVLTPAHEHILSVALRRVLSWLIGTLPAPPDAPLVMFGTLPGQRHEFGAMLAAVFAASRRRRISYLGPDLPVTDIVHAAILTRASVVAISVLGAVDLRVLRQELTQLRAALPESIFLVVGGQTVTRYARALRTTGATVLPDLNAWDAWLQSVTVA